MYTPWGKSIAINLFDCDLSLISDPEAIKRFIAEVITVIGMKAHGPCYVERFGTVNNEGYSLEGYSAMQFIETSAITIHCDEPERRAFIDIFSCKDFDSAQAEEFSKTFFKAQKCTSTTLER